MIFQDKNRAKTAASAMPVYDTEIVYDPVFSTRRFEEGANGKLYAMR